MTGEDAELLSLTHGLMTVTGFPWVVTERQLGKTTDVALCHCLL